MDKDILNTKIYAHIEYILPKIINDDKRKDFLRTLQELMDDKIPLPRSESGGVEMAIDIYFEILHYHKRRFEDGRYRTNFYLEKI